MIIWSSGENTEHVTGAMHSLKDATASHERVFHRMTRLSPADVARRSPRCEKATLEI